MKARANGIEIEYEDYGPNDAPPALLIMGLGAQLTLWPMPMVDQLVERGYRVIRYDNRDVGLSTKLDHAQTPAMATLVGQMMMGVKPDVPYLIADMAADAVGLLDALGIDKAHVIGGSMGGMIAQMVAATHPGRVLSLTSIFSTTGNPAVGQATPEAMAVLTQRPTGDDEEAMVAHGVRAEKVIGSPGYPADEAELAARVRRDFRRMHYPAGIARQMAAIIASGDRREALKTIAAPTMVIHGIDDPLVPVAGGRDTAATIPGAKIVEIPGMGHNLPETLIPQILDAFEEVARANATVES